jgi:hypothetical protein
MRIAAFPKAYLKEMVIERTMTVFDWIRVLLDEDTRRDHPDQGRAAGGRV